MKNEDLKVWLNLHNNDEEVECWVKIGDDELSHPNMATVPRDEIFEWQDELDDIDYVDDNEENMLQLFNFIDGILDKLESRLQINPELIKQLEEVDKKIEAGDLSDFVELDPKEFEISFWDIVDNFAKATKIREYVDASDVILSYARSRLPKLDIYIEGSYLYIIKKGNASISTSIIAQALNIEALDIDDKGWEESVYRIKLEER